MLIPAGIPNCTINFARSPLQVSGFAGSALDNNLLTFVENSVSNKRSVPANKISLKLVPKLNLPNSIPLDISANPSM